MEFSEDDDLSDVYVLVCTRYGVADVLGVYTNREKARCAKEAYEALYVGQGDVALSISRSSIDKLPR